LWLRVCESDAADTAFFGRKNHGLWEYFGELKSAAEENGYKENPDIPVSVEYYSQTGVGSHYAYLPII